MKNFGYKIVGVLHAINKRCAFRKKTVIGTDVSLIMHCKGWSG